jgi:hypothetical protein
MGLVVATADILGVVESGFPGQFSFTLISSMFAHCFSSCTGPEDVGYGCRYMSRRACGDFTEVA